MGDSFVSSSCEEIGTRAVKKVYLITYSNANTEIYDRDKFSTLVTKVFENVCNHVTVVQLACCKEQHENGAYHFHMCILLSKLQPWLKVKNCIKERHGIVPNFSGHGGYHSAFTYVSKQDKGYITSGNHPKKIDLPKTTNATKKKASHQCKMPKVKRLCNLDVSNVIVKNKLRSRIDLLAFAKSAFDKGDKGLYAFVLNRGDKKVNDLHLVWEMETAKKKQERAAQTRLEILREQLTTMCICNGQWLECALEILQRNGIERVLFADAIVALLALGRGKGRNIYITGPANCGKTFILDPLKVIFNTFLSPACC